MTKGQEVLELAAAFERRAKTPTNQATSEEFLLAASALRLAAQPQSSLMEQPQYVVEGIILRRIYEKRIEGYTIEMAKEIVEALSDTRPDRGGEA
jgi:hypothetical protein